MSLTQLADEAIGLFLEYRDVHGYDDEDVARAKAIGEFVDAESFTGELASDRPEVVPGWTVEEILEREG